MKKIARLKLLRTEDIHFALSKDKVLSILSSKFTNMKYEMTFKASLNDTDDGFKANIYPKRARTGNFYETYLIKGEIIADGDNSTTVRINYVRDNFRYFTKFYVITALLIIALFTYFYFDYYGTMRVVLPAILAVLCIPVSVFWNESIKKTDAGLERFINELKK